MERSLSRRRGRPRTQPASPGAAVRTELRLEPELHRALVRVAEDAGVSLNAAVCAFLAWGVERKLALKKVSVAVVRERDDGET